jgi:bifunctional non-homologous end joining protein LigD
MAKRARQGKIYLDYLRNVRGATAVLPYSVRARDRLPVAMPIEWAELDSIEPMTFTVSSVPGWLERRRRDPCAEMRSSSQSMTRKVLDAFEM